MANRTFYVFKLIVKFWVDVLRLDSCYNTENEKSWYAISSVYQELQISSSLNFWEICFTFPFVLLS